METPKIFESEYRFRLIQWEREPVNSTRLADLSAQILEASFHGGVVILVILGLRLVLRNAPWNAICLLWLLAAVRLVCPVTVESSLSLQPDFRSSIRTENTLTQENLNQYPGMEETPVDAVGSTEGWDEDVVISTGDAFETPDAAIPEEPAIIDWFRIAPWVWLAGVGILALYAIISYVNLKRKVRDSIRLEGEIYLRPGLDSAFVLGFVRPRIYLPHGPDGNALPYVIAHERAHIARKDHIWKLVGFGVLTIHWFNPLVWVAYSLLCRDLELACDEKVVREMSIDQRKAYSMALVSCAARHSHLGASPVAFGEVDVKGRVKAVLNYKKPGFWIVLIAVIAIVAVVVFFMTSPGMTDKEVLQCFYAEMDALQGRDSIHLLVTEELETEFPYLLDRQQEYWISGEDWYGVWTYNLTRGDYEIRVAQVNGTQLRCNYSKDFDVTGNGVWKEVEPENYSNITQLLTTDWAKESVREICRENGGYTIVVEGYRADESQYTTFENEYTFRLDGNGKLVGINRYDRSETIHKAFDLSGYYETATTFTYTFLEPDGETFTRLVAEASAGAGWEKDNVWRMEQEKAELEKEKEEQQIRHITVWFQGLSAENVECIQSTVMECAGDHTYHYDKGKELADLIALLEEFHCSSIIAEPEIYDGGTSVKLCLTMADGTTREITNVCNRYLLMDGTAYEVDTEWLQRWPHEGDAAASGHHSEHYNETQ